MDAAECDSSLPHLSPGATTPGASDARLLVLPKGEEIDCNTADDIFDPLDEAAQTGGKHLILDGRGLTFCDSTGLARLVRLSQKCRLAGCLLVVIPGPYLARLLEMTGLAVWLTLADDEASARALLPDSVAS